MLNHAGSKHNKNTQNTGDSTNLPRSNESVEGLVLDHRMEDDVDYSYEEMSGIKPEREQLAVEVKKAGVNDESDPGSNSLSAWVFLLPALCLTATIAWFVAAGNWEVIKLQVNNWMALGVDRNSDAASVRTVVSGIMHDRKEIDSAPPKVSHNADLQNMIDEVFQKNVSLETQILESDTVKSMDRFNMDQDEDHISDFMEISLGTDPQKVDSDGDGREDLDEILEGQNPRGYGLLFYDLEETPWLLTDNILTDAVLHLGVKGVNGNLLQPMGLISRVEFLKMLLNALKIDPERLDMSDFTSDMPPEDWRYEVMGAASTLGLITSLVPDQPITRAEAVVIINRFAQWSTPTQSQFADVDMHAWYGYDVNALAKQGIISGNAQGNFEPDVPLNRAQAIKIIELSRRILMK